MSMYLSIPTMKCKYFDSHRDLADYMYEKAYDDENYVVSVLFYEDAIKLMRELVKKDDVKVVAVDVAPVEYNGYDKEYYVSLTDDMYLAVEPAYSETNERYLATDADILLIHGDANSRILGTIDFRRCKEIGIKPSEYDEFDF